MMSAQGVLNVYCRHSSLSMPCSMANRTCEILAAEADVIECKLKQLLRRNVHIPVSIRLYALDHLYRPAVFILASTLAVLRSGLCDA